MTTADTRQIRQILFDTDQCWKCAGTGYIPAYSGISGGRCYPCNGQGKLLTRAAKARRKTYDAFMAERLTIQIQDIEPGMWVRYGTQPYRRAVQASPAVEGVGPANILADGTRKYMDRLEVEDSKGERSSIWGCVTIQRRPTSQDLADVVAAFGRARTGYTVTYVD